MNRKYLKYDAKLKIEPLKPHVYYVSLVYVLISLVLGAVEGELRHIVGEWDKQAYEFIVRLFYPPVPPNRVIIAYAFLIVLGILSLFVSVGFMSFALRISRGRNVGIYNLGDGFSHAGKLFVILVLESVFIFLWSLLFIIPGLVAAYRYRLAYYILLDDPHKSPLQCIRESKELMRGYKGELFVLDLSFIGWQFLILLTFGILGIWKEPYIAVTYANFYNTLACPDGFFPPDREEGGLGG